MTDELNPYRPPFAQVELAPQAGGDMALAGKGRRFATLLIDYIAFYIVAIIIGVVMAIAGAGAALANMGRGEQYLFGFVLFLAYYMFFEALWQRTPGKLILGTRVIDEKGGRPGATAILKRTLARMIPFEPFSFFGDPGSGWHDKLSHTRVVRTR